MFVEGRGESCDDRRCLSRSSFSCSFTFCLFSGVSHPFSSLQEFEWSSVSVANTSIASKSSIIGFDESNRWSFL
jgi:hypothetical protein